MSDQCWVPWFGGLTCDHIYANCTNRTRVTGKVEREWCAATGEGLNAHGTDVCGMCLHRHNREHHAAREADMTDDEGAR